MGSNVEATPVLDLETALERVGGDEDLLREISAIFLQECPPAITELRSAVAARDPVTIERKAHSLKGSISTFGNGEPFHDALTLEQQGRNRDLTEVDQNLQRFEASLDRLCGELQALVGN